MPVASALMTSQKRCHPKPNALTDSAPTVGRCICQPRSRTKDSVSYDACLRNVNALWRRISSRALLKKMFSKGMVGSARLYFRMIMRYVGNMHCTVALRTGFLSEGLYSHRPFVDLDCAGCSECPFPFHLPTRHSPLFRN